MAEIKTNLPPLPMQTLYVTHVCLQRVEFYGYTADQMRAYAEAAVLSANAGKVDEDVLSDLAVTAFSKWQEKEGVKSVDQCKSFCAGYMYASADRIETTQQAIDAGKV